MTRTLCVLCLMGCALWAAADGLPVAKAMRAEGEVRIDGRLDEPFWEKAPVYSDFHRLDRRGGFATEMERTEFRVAHDGQSLLVGITCHDPNMDDLIAEVTERDGPSWSDDAVEIFIRLDDRFYYQFAVNNIGTVYDARVPVVDGSPGPDVSRGRLWDGIVDAAVTHGDTCWTVEVRIPFATLDIGPQTMRTWRFNVGRSAARRKDYSSWSPVKRGFNDLPWHGFLEGIEFDADRFAIDATALEFPPLRLGSNVLSLSLPARRPGNFVVNSSLRQWERGRPLPALRQEGAAVTVTGGMLPIAFRLPVTTADVLKELVLEVADAQTGKPVLQRMHLFRAPQPMAATLEWAVYYQSEKQARLDVDITVAPESAKGTLHASIFSGEKLLRHHEVVIAQPGRIEAMLPIGELSPELYRLTVTAEMNGLPAITRQMRFHIVPGPFDRE